MHCSGCDNYSAQLDMCVCVCVYAFVSVYKVYACLLIFVMYAYVCLCVCLSMFLCVCVFTPHGLQAVQKMSRGCGGSSGGVGSVTRRGQWWDRTALQQQGSLQNQTQAGFEYCIRALVPSPHTPEALPSFWGKSAHRASASADLITLELVESDQTFFSVSVSFGVWATHVCWRVSVCLCKCDDILGRCYCE